MQTAATLHYERHCCLTYMHLLPEPQCWAQEGTLILGNRVQHTLTLAC